MYCLVLHTFVLLLCFTYVFIAVFVLLVLLQIPTFLQWTKQGLPEHRAFSSLNSSVLGSPWLHCIIYMKCTGYTGCRENGYIMCCSAWYCSISCHRSEEVVQWEHILCLLCAHRHSVYLQHCIAVSSKSKGTFNKKYNTQNKQITANWLQNMKYWIVWHIVVSL